jgi:hypothetical protein
LLLKLLSNGQRRNNVPARAPARDDDAHEVWFRPISLLCK